jgi:Ca-activated chloride channel family protein
MMFFLCGLTSQTPAQSPSPTPVEDVRDVVRVDTTLVNLPVTVMNRQGRFVPNLRPEDFHIYEDGVEQHIAHFAEVEKPLVVALLLDTSASTSFRLADIKAAAIAFIDQLRPDDRVMVIAFSDQVDVIAEPTADHRLLRAAVLAARSGNSTHLYDAVDLVLNQRFNRISGRKAIVLLTDGVDHVSIESRAGNLHAAEETDAIICSVQYDTFFDQTRIAQWGSEITRNTTRLYPPGLGREDYRRATAYLNDLATKSGGEYFHAPDLGNIKHAFARIAEQLRSQYSLGYYPAKITSETQSRTLSVKVGRRGLVVRTRRSYIYEPPKPAVNPKS